jgi:NitT/TauT family transport system substrate-binding protein
MKKYISISIILFLLVFLITGCSSEQNSKEKTIVIAEQYGLAYAPVQLIKELKLLEENSELKVEWKQLSNTTAIREAMLAGEVDIGFMAIPPFLIAKDKGMDWKIISGLSESPLGLMSNKENINSLADFKAENRIALPQPGSIQHILLSMAAENELGNAEAFDNQLLTMNHPDAMNSLLAGKELSAHFASPPYLFLESRETGIKQILSAKDAFGGDFTFIVGVSTIQFYQSNLKNYQLFEEALAKAIKYINEKSDKSAEILAANYNLDQKELAEYLSWPGMRYTQEIKGLEKFMKFMAAEGYLSRGDYPLSELIFDQGTADSDEK